MTRADMQITVNGGRRRLEPGLTVGQLIERLDVPRGRLAVEVNGEIVPRGAFPSRRLAAGDAVEIVQAIGGG